MDTDTPTFRRSEEDKKSTSIYAIAGLLVFMVVPYSLLCNDEK
jgi:hypothetical protein